MKTVKQLTYPYQVRLQEFLDKPLDQLNDMEKIAQEHLAPPLRKGTANISTLMDMVKAIPMDYVTFQKVLNCLPDREAAMELLTDCAMLNKYRFASDKTELNEITHFVSEYFNSDDAVSFWEKIDPRAFQLKAIENFNSADIFTPMLARTPLPVMPLSVILSKISSANEVSGLIKAITDLYGDTSKTIWVENGGYTASSQSLGRVISWSTSVITTYEGNGEARAEDRHTFNLNPLIDYVMNSDPTTEDIERLIELIEHIAKKFPERDFERQFMLAVLDKPNVTNLYRRINDEMEEHYLSVPHREATDEHYNKVNLEIEKPYVLHRDRALSLMRDIHFANADNDNLELIRKAVNSNDNIRVGLATYLTYFGEPLGSNQLTAVSDLESEGGRTASHTLMKVLKRESENLIIQAVPNTVSDEFKNKLPQWTEFYREKLGLDTDEGISPR